jgi:hypothetical protein
MDNLKAVYIAAYKKAQSDIKWQQTFEDAKNKRKEALVKPTNTASTAMKENVLDDFLNKIQLSETSAELTKAYDAAITEAKKIGDTNNMEKLKKALESRSKVLDELKNIEF